MIIVNFIGNEVEKYIRGLDQYDRGQILCISGLDLPKFVEVQFSLQETGGLAERIVGITTDGVTEVEIPNYMLTNNDATSDYEIYAYVYVTNETSAETVYKITMEVNSRPKPNPYDTPEDIGMFNRVIEVMKDSVTAAENAAGTSEKNAQKTGEDRKAIEEMVGTITGIEQQVQDVKEYAGQAKTAAENALLSEQEAKKSEGAALQHRTGAETAENNAELAEQNAKKSEQAVEQTKQLVMQMGQQVLQDKNQVDGKVEEFNKTVKDASDAIETVKTDAVGAVETAGTEQTKKVADEGTKQVKAVEDEGNKVLQSIPEDFVTQIASKLDKQQGAENKGKAMIVGEDGILIPGEMHGGEKWRFLRTVTVPADPKTDQSGVVWKLNSDGAILGFTFDTDENGEKFSLDDVRWYGTVKSNGIADGYRYFYLKDINSHSIAGYRMWYETCNAVYGALNRTGNRLYPLENCTTQFNPNAKIKSGCGNATSGFVTNYKYTCFGMACTNMFLEEGTVYHVYGKE